MILPHPQPTKTCPRCSRPFTCRPDACWCKSLWVPAAMLEALRKQYTGCLCQSCLQELAGQSPSPSPSHK